jgi:hypothetical protein
LNTRGVLSRDSRGNDVKAIFHDDRPGEILELLGRAVEEFHLCLHGYRLMSNHYHLLVEASQGGLNRALRYLKVYRSPLRSVLFIAASLFDGATGDWEEVGLHYSAVGNAIRQVRERPTLSRAKSLRELEITFKIR